MTNQVTVKYGSGLKGYGHLQSLYSTVLETIEAQPSDDLVLSTLKNIPGLSYLNFESSIEATASNEFSGDVKSATFLRDALQNPLRCKICGGLVHRNSITIDHITRKQDGGLGDMDNAQLAHPYCNTTFKN